MTESAYARDPRVVWHDSPQCFTVATGADPPPAVYQGAIDGDPDIWVCRPDPPWERIEGVPDSVDLDEVLHALIGEPVTREEVGLLIWATRREGWLTVQFVDEFPNGRDGMARLVEQGAFEYHEDHGGGYALTEAGAARAAQAAAWPAWEED